MDKFHGEIFSLWKLKRQIVLVSINLPMWIPRLK